MSDASHTSQAHNQPHEHEHGATSPAHLADTVGPLHVSREFTFRFKKQTEKDELGQEIKRAPVTVSVPVPTFPGLVKALEDSKVQEFVMDLIEESIKGQVRAQIADSEKPINRQEDLDLSKFDLTYIANMPKTERTGGGISAETWTEFEKDYIHVITTHTDKGQARAEKAAKLLVAKFNPVRTDKPVIAFLREQLAFWAAHTSQGDDLAEVFMFLDNKAGVLLTRDTKELLASL